RHVAKVLRVGLQLLEGLVHLLPGCLDQDRLSLVGDLSRRFEGSLDARRVGAAGPRPGRPKLRAARGDTAGDMEPDRLGRDLPGVALALDRDVVAREDS